MKLSVLLLVITLAGLCCTRSTPIVEECVVGKYPPAKNLSVAWYTVDLDLPPFQRWNAVGEAKRNEIRALIFNFKDFLHNLTDSDFFAKLVDTDLAPLANTLPQPFQDEIKGMANVTGIPLGEIVLYNIFYEINPFCTSIVAEDAHGKLYHARNLDFGLFMGWNVKDKSWILTEYLRQSVVNLHFTKGGKVVYSTTNFAGYIGVLTGMKKGYFSLTINHRFSLNGGYIGFVEWILGKRDAWWIGHLTRHVMETASSFKEANKTLATVPMIAPIYFILGGNKSQEISVITRDRLKSDIWIPTQTNHTWYLLETNYDHWKAPMFLDDRRTPANRCMQQKGKAVMGFDALFNVLSSRPMLNKLTTYTTLMQVNSGRMETYLQYCTKNCMPW